MKYNVQVIEESNSTLRERITSALTKEGFRVAAATSYEKALLRLDEFEPELIILGDGLPIDTFKACYQVRQAASVPILMLGRVPGGKAWAKSVEAGADFYLVQPFSYPELVARVKALLRRYELTRSNDNGKVKKVR